MPKTENPEILMILSLKRVFSPPKSNSIQKSKPAQQKIQIKLFKQDQTTNFENKQIFAATFNFNPTLYSP